jgi:hypothetical protein
VTNAENNYRGISPWALNKRKTHCLRGHPFDDANTYVNPAGARVCRTCRAEYRRAYDRRRHAVADPA